MFKYSIAFCLLLPTSAYADRIDGTWCTGAATRVEINGPKISLGGKPAFDGTYTRHQFIYIVPEGEANAGDKVYMQVLGDEDMSSYTVKENKAVDPLDWKRCQATS